MLTGKPLFPGKNVIHQLELITDLLGTPSHAIISKIRNEKARRYLNSMRKKPPVPFSQKFPNIDPLALRLLERLIAFDTDDRLTAAEALADPYFYGLANVEDEPSTKPISKFEFDFERRNLTKDDVRELIYREILEYHPHMLQEYLLGSDQIHFMYPSGVDQFKEQFCRLEEDHGKIDKILHRRYASLPRERVCMPIDEDLDQNAETNHQIMLQVPHPSFVSPKKSPDTRGSDATNPCTKAGQSRGCKKSSCSARYLLRSASISASKCVGVEGSRLL